MTIGRYLKAENKYFDKNKNQREDDVLDIRTFSFRKRFTISLNLKKHTEGKYKNNVQAEMVDKPDYHVWWNPSNKGEKLKSEIIGSFKLTKSENNLVYLKGFIQDPSFDKGVMWLAIFNIEDNTKRTAENHTANIVWSPPRPATTNNNNSYNAPMAQASYEEGNIEVVFENVADNVNNNLNAAAAKSSHDEDEIPF